MPRSAKNKTKAWRRETEIHMIPQEVESQNEAGETVKETIEVPYLLKGRMLRDHRLRQGKMAPMASNLMINLTGRLVYDTIENDETDVVSESIDEPIVETL